MTKKWEITVDATDFDGNQVFACEADTEEEALETFKRSECEIIEVNIEVLGLDRASVNIEESDDITSRLGQDVAADLSKQLAELRQLNEELKKKDANKYILLTKREFELMGQEVSSSYSQAGCMDYESALCANAAHTAYRRAETRNASKLYPEGTSNDN